MKTKTLTLGFLKLSFILLFSLLFNAYGFAWSFPNSNSGHVKAAAPQATCNPNLKIGIQTVGIGQVVEIPVSADFTNPECQIISIEFDLFYDGTLLEYKGYQQNASLSGASYAVNTNNNNLQVAIVSSSNINTNGDFITLKFVAKQAGVTEVSFESAKINQNLTTNVTNGSVTVEGFSNQVSLPNSTATTGQLISVPVTTDNLGAALNLISANLILNYDASLVDYESYSVDGCILPTSANVVVNNENGKLQLSIMSDVPLSGGPKLIILNFRAKKSGASPLTFSKFTFNDFNVTNIQNGKITITDLKAQVSLTDQIVSVGQQFDIPVKTTSFSSAANIISASFILDYDENLMEYVSYQTNDPFMLPDIFIEVNAVNGKIKVAVMSDSPIIGVKELLSLRFKAKNKGTGALTFDKFTYNGNQISTLVNGSVTIDIVKDVTLSKNEAVVGQLFPITVSTGAINPLSNLISASFSFSYDPTLMEYESYSVDGTILPANPEIEINANNGKLNVAIITQQALAGAGDLIKLNFRAKKDGICPLVFNSFKYNTYSVDNLINGETTIKAFAPQVTLIADDADEGKEILIALTTEELLTEAQIISCSFELIYAPTILEYKGYSLNGTSITQDATVEVKAENGRLKLGAYSPVNITAIQGSKLIWLKFRTKKRGISPLTLENFRYNNYVNSNTISGSINVGSFEPAINVEGIYTGKGLIISPTVFTEAIPADFNIISVEFELSYNPDIIRFIDYVEIGNILPNGANVLISDKDKGKLKVAIMSPEPIIGGDALLELRFEAINLGVSPLDISNFKYNQWLNTNVSNNTVHVVEGEGGCTPKVSVGPLTKEQYTDFDVTVDIGSIDSLCHVISYDFELDYDPAVVQFLGLDRTNTLTPAGDQAVVNDKDGLLKISLASSSKIKGSGGLIKLRFKAIGYGDSKIAIKRCRLNNYGDCPIENKQIYINGINEICPQQISVEYPESSYAIGSIVEVAVRTGYLSEKCHVISSDFYFSYNPSILEFIGESTTPNLFGNGESQIIKESDGKLKLACAWGEEITGVGDLVVLRFRFLTGGVSSLNISDFRYNNVPITNIKNNIIGVDNSSGYKYYFPFDQCYGSKTSDFDKKVKCELNSSAWSEGYVNQAIKPGNISIFPHEGLDLCNNPDFSFSAWIKPASAYENGKIEHIISRGTLYIDKQFELFLDQQNGANSLCFRLYEQSGNIINIHSNLDGGAFPVEPGFWSHFVVLKQGNTLKIYINGNLANSLPLTEEIIPLKVEGYLYASFGAPTTMEGKYENTNYTLDEFRFYDFPLNTIEIKKLAKTVSSPENCQLLSYFNLSRKNKGEFYLVSDDVLRFKYFEEYFVGTSVDEFGDLEYKIYALPTLDQQQGLAVLPVAYGENKYDLDISVITDGYYLMEVSNDKNEKWYLRFRKM